MRVSPNGASLVGITLLFIAKRRQTRTVGPKAAVVRTVIRKPHRTIPATSLIYQHRAQPTPRQQNSEHGTSHKEWNFAPIGLYGFAILDECFSLQAI